MNQAMAIKLYEGTLLITRIAMLNLLWLLFCILGAGLFGWLPATITLVSVYRRSYQQDGEFKWFQYAWQQFFVNLKRFFGLSLVASGIFVSLYLSYLTLGQQGIFFNRLILVLGSYLLFLVLPYFAVNEVHFEVKLLAALKNSFMLPFFWGFTTIKILATFFGTAILCYLIPGIIPFFSCSLPLFLVTNQLLKRWEQQLKSLGLADEVDHD